MSAITPLSVSISWSHEQIQLSYRLIDYEIVKNTRGFAFATLVFNGSLEDVMSIARRERGNIEVYYGPEEIWSGKIDDVEINGSIITVTAVGGWASLARGTLFEVYSDIDQNRFVEALAGDSDHMIIRKSPRIRFTPRQNNDYSNASADKGILVYYEPDDGENIIERVEIEYEILGDVDWQMDIRTSVGVVSSVNASTPTPATGSLTLDTSAMAASNANFVAIDYYYDNATRTTYTGETGTDNYCMITNFRIFFKNQATITARDIALDMLSKANAMGLEVSADTSKIGDTFTTDIIEFRPEDISFAEAFEQLAALADVDTPSSDIEMGVFEGGKLVFRKPQDPKKIYARIKDFTIRRSGAYVFNRAYATGWFQEKGYLFVRGDIQVDQDSVAKFGIKTAFLDTEITALADRNAAALAVVEANKRGKPEVEVEFSNFFYGPASKQISPYLIRPYNVVQLMNVPVGLSELFGNVEELRVEEVVITPAGVALQLVRPSSNIDQQIATLKQSV